jgi:hypothetical protein
MGTKQIQTNFLIVADDGVSANVTITVDGISKWNGVLTNTNATIPGADTPDVAFSVAEFDLEVDNLGNTSPYTTSKDITMTVTGGSAIFKSMLANYNGSKLLVEPVTTPPTYTNVPGNSTTFVQVLPTAQPTWNGVPILTRMDYADGANGPMLFESGEVLAFPVEISDYSA